MGPWILMLFAGGAVFFAAVIFTLGLGYILLVPVLAWGGTKFLLNTVDGEAEFGDLFAGFSRYGEALWGMLGAGLAIVATLMPGYILSAIGMAFDGAIGGLIGALGSLVVMLSFLLVYPRLLFAPFYVVDQGMRPMEALRASWDATEANKVSTVLFFVLTMAVTFAGMLALLVGLIPATMVTYSGMAAAYRQISSTTR